MQVCTSLDTNAWINERVPWSGTGSALTATVETTGKSNLFFRVLVLDTDSDGDGATDWEEIAAGFNPNSTPGTGDFEAIESALNAPNILTISASKSLAVVEGSIPGSFTISRTEIFTRQGDLHAGRHGDSGSSFSTVAAFRDDPLRAQFRHHSDHADSWRHGGPIPDCYADPSATKRLCHKSVSLLYWFVW